MKRDYRDVSCPYCFSKIGKTCVSSNKKITKVHPQRKVASINSTISYISSYILDEQGMVERIK